MKQFSAGLYSNWLAGLSFEHHPVLVVIFSSNRYHLPVKPVNLSDLWGPRQCYSSCDRL